MASIPIPLFPLNPGPPRSLGEAIKQARIGRSWSCRQLADKLGLCGEQVRLYEAGAQCPRPAVLARIADTLEISLDLLLSLWIREEYSAADDEPVRRRLLASLEHQSQQELPHHGLIDELESRRDPHLHTALKAFRKIMIDYRKRLTQARGDKHDVRVCQYHPSDRHMLLDNMQRVEHRPVGRSDKGIGFLFTIVKIKAGMGLFHEHSATGPLSPGTEFFSVLFGEGTWFIQAPQHARSHGPQKIWTIHPASPGTVGHYRGDLGHCCVADRGVDLSVCLVCVPFPAPPRLSRGKLGGAERRVGAMEEFELTKLNQARIPLALKRLISSR